MKPDITKMLDEAAGWRTKVQAKTKPSAAASWYSISNAADTDTATIRIYDEISWFGVDALTFADDLEQITASTIEVAINSPGGNVFDGLAIFNALRTHPARIVTRVDGLAASAASFIAQAGDERIMVDSSQMMIHDAWGVMAGNAKEFREYAEFLEQQSVNIAALYAARADDEAHDTGHYAELMGAETWLNAAEAVEQGLADRVLTPNRQTATGPDDSGKVVADNKISTETPEPSTAAAVDQVPVVDVVHMARTELVRARTELAVRG